MGGAGRMPGSSGKKTSLVRGDSHLRGSETESNNDKHAGKESRISPRPTHSQVILRPPNSPDEDACLQNKRKKSARLRPKPFFQMGAGSCSAKFTRTS